MDETNFVKRVREGRVSGHSRGCPKKSWNEVVKDMKKRSLYINGAQERNKWRQCYRREVDPS